MNTIMKKPDIIQGEKPSDIAVSLNTEPEEMFKIERS